jgi:hypothetical protein
MIYPQPVSEKSAYQYGPPFGDFHHAAAWILDRGGHVYISPPSAKYAKRAGQVHSAAFAQNWSLHTVLNLVRSGRLHPASLKDPK